MKCFGVEIGEISKVIKLKASGLNTKLSATSTIQNVRLKLKSKEEKLNIQSLNLIILLLTKYRDNSIKVILNNYLLKPFKIFEIKGNKLTLNISIDLKIKLKTKKKEEVIFILDKYDDILFICIPLCKLRRKHEFLRSLDDESLIDIEGFLLKSIIEYGKERFN